MNNRPLSSPPDFRRLWDNDNFSSLIIMGMRTGMLGAKFILSIFMARYMGLEELGIYGLIVGASGTIQSVLRGGVFATLSRNVVHQSLAELIHDLRHYLTGILLLYVLLTPVAWLAGWQFGQPVVALLALVVILTEHLALDSYILINNLQHPKLANFLFSLQSASWIYVFVILAFFFESLRSIETLLGFWMGGGLVALIIPVMLSRRWPWREGAAKKMELQWYAAKLKSSSKLYFADVTGVLNHYMDRYIVTAFLSLEMTGIYVFFSQVVTATWNLINSGVLAVYAPRLIKAYDADNIKPFDDLYRVCIKRTYLAALSLAIFSGVVVPYMVTFTDNPALLSHIPLLWIMLFAMLFRTGTTCAGSGLFAMHKDREKFIIEIIGFFVTLVVGSVGVITFGVYGIVLNTVVVATISILYARSVWFKKPTVEDKGRIVMPDSSLLNISDGFFQVRKASGGSLVANDTYGHLPDAPVKKTRPCKIMIISSIFYPHVFGGAEVAAYNRAKFLVKQGFEVSVVTLQEHNMPPAWGMVTAEGFRLYRIKVPRDYTLLERTHKKISLKKVVWHLQDYFDVRNRKLIGAVLDHAKPDHVEIDNLIGIGFNALTEIGRRDLPVSYVLHDLNLACFKTGMIRKKGNCKRQCISCRGVATVRQRNLAKIKRLGFVSPSYANLEKARKYVPAIDRSLSCVMRNLPEDIPVLPERQSSSQIRLIFVGRLDPVKGIEFLLETLAPLSKAHNFHLTILGTGPSEKALKEKYGHKEWVDFRGFVNKNEVAAALSQSDLYCIPSLVAESYGLVTAQALQLGIPVLGSNAGGTAELVRDGVTGGLVPPGDAEAWRDAFLKIFADPGVLQSWHKNAVRYAHEFDPQEIGLVYEAFIEKLYALPSARS